MKTCKLRGEFEYIQYTEETKLEVKNLISKHGFTRLEMQVKTDWIIYCTYYPLQIKIDNIEIVKPGDYLIELDENTLGHYDEAIFNNTFFDKEIGE